jgi:hypothetical protein
VATMDTVVSSHAGEAHPALADGTGRREAVTVVRRTRAGGRAAQAERGATVQCWRPRGASGRRAAG